jgi:hypothetical protein
MKLTRAFVKCLYGLIGVIFVVLGTTVLLFNTGILPDAVRRALLEESRGDLTTLHVVQELGTALVFIGLITFWFIRHYQRSQAFHWMLTVFWGLLALVHWFDVRGPSTSTIGPLINGMPFMLFVAIGAVRVALEGRSPGQVEREC